MNCNTCKNKGMLHKCFISGINPEYAHLCTTYQRRPVATVNQEFEASVKEMVGEIRTNPFAGLYIDRSRV